MSQQRGPAEIMAEWSDARLESELDQAMATSSDESVDPAMRDSALWAAALMATEIAERRTAK